LLLGHFQEREQMLDVRVHAAVAKETEEVQLALAAALHRLLEQRNILQLLVGDEQINARHVHVDDAAGADVEMADFAVAHLPFRQADERPGSVDQRVGKIFDQGVISGFASQRDGVASCFRAVAPTVEHGEYDGFRSFGHSSSGYMDEQFLSTREKAQSQ
jgi:predicted exporter